MHSLNAKAICQTLSLFFISSPHLSRLQADWEFAEIARFPRLHHDNMTTLRSQVPGNLVEKFLLERVFTILHFYT